ncbi:MAG: N-acetyl sugar amidotransferase [Chitinophagales bacterium]|nr:N-acetyl sugar amidotransferase [Chitinophagales bacterium]
MNHRKYQQCKRCVMDTTDPDIQFDENGICNLCTDFLKKRKIIMGSRSADKKEFEALIEKIKNDGKHKKYDTILGISGGVDSCYAAYLLKQNNIRVLLVHMDNGWNSDDSILNIKNIAKKLGYDYESYVLDWEEFKDVQLAFLRASVVEAETPTDVAILGVLHRIAAKYHVKYIISGGNLATEGILPPKWHYNAKDTRYFNYIQKRFGTKKIRKFPNFGFKTELYYKFIKGIRIIYLLNYVNYNKDNAMKILQNELGWRYYGGKHYESRFTKFVQSYLLPKKFNLDYRKATFSSQICAGNMTREEAIEALKAPVYNEEDIEREKEYIAKKLCISKAELNEIIETPGKYYYEYPNDEKKLNFLYGVYRKYFS